MAQALVTFIIPSINRPTLRRALDSIAAQTNVAFRAVLIMDGCKAPEFVSSYTWLQTITLPSRVGTRNYAGEVRNIGIREVTTEWIAFLDDDDTIAPSYVNSLAEEIRRRPGADAVIFRMRTNKTTGHRVLPPKGATDFVKNEVGISFAVRTFPRCMKGETVFSFEPGPTEDFCALDFLRSRKAEIVLSESVTYFVEMDPEL
jgi:glycosyltransferase involved in cell wall biosynthesis